MSTPFEIKLTPRQWDFVSATADEVLFGGAAGGGKSFGQLVDALLYALRYPGSKQLILRRTYPELEKSLIRTALELFPTRLFSYRKSAHSGTFVGGSVLDFGYLDTESDVFKYQSAEYDVIRFDELTHFTERMYVYLISRLRGANSFPKSVRSTTNPGGVGHGWVKARFVDIGEPDKVYRFTTGSRLFLPSLVQDNLFLMQSDPEYVRRLQNLPEQDRKALLEGDWDIFDGQFFTEWNRRLHVIEPHPIDAHCRRYFVMDYGLDMLAGYWIAVDSMGNATVYRELYEGKDNGGEGLIVSAAARKIRQMTGDESICAYLAPPDLWSRQKDSGKSIADLFREGGVPLRRAPNRRIDGWLQLKEWLAPRTTESGAVRPRLQIFSGCINLIRTLPALTAATDNPGDVATTPHELTHAPDALRYFAAALPRGERPHHTPNALPPFAALRPKPNPVGQGERIKVI